MRGLRLYKEDSLLDHIPLDLVFRGNLDCQRFFTWTWQTFFCRITFLSIFGYFFIFWMSRPLISYFRLTMWCSCFSGGMSCNNAQLITQKVSEVVTHYTGYYTAKNRKKCLNYTKIHKFQGWFFYISWPKWLILKILEKFYYFGGFSTQRERKILAPAT